jgi:hypothetical protein
MQVKKVREATQNLRRSINAAEESAGVILGNGEVKQTPF